MSQLTFMRLKFKEDLLLTVFFFLQIYTQLSRQEVAQKTDAADWLQETKKLRN